jgi:hypothetical protein
MAKMKKCDKREGGAIECYFAGYHVDGVATCSESRSKDADSSTAE